MEFLTFTVKCLICVWLAHRILQTTALTSTNNCPSRQRPSLRTLHSMDVSSTEEEEGIGVGIDLGTTNSCIAFLEGKTPKIVEIPGNGRTMKSVVAFDADGLPLVGNEAIQWEERNKMSGYRHVKRVIGTGATFLSKETAQVVPHLVRYNTKRTIGKGRKQKQPTLAKILTDAEDNPCRLLSLNNDENEVERTYVSPETVSAAILERLLDVAKMETEKPITRAVIGVPAYFNDAQRDATIRAANQAGLEKVRLLREPEAAALAYGVEKATDEELVLVFDLGGGTYDVSVLLVEAGLTEVMCTSGNAQLGGSDFDAKVAKKLHKLTNGCCRSESARDLVLRIAEMIRIRLSNSKRVNLILPLTETGWTDIEDQYIDSLIYEEAEPFESGTSNATHCFQSISRKEVEKLCIEELTMLLRPIREVAVMAGAMLPGDARPSIVESALELETAFTEGEEAFYEDDANSGQESPATEEIDYKELKKKQRKGRKNARTVAKKERVFKAESRKAGDIDADIKVRGDGISGRPITRVVLVGGATRMPAIGRIISMLAGVIPQKTIDPDEAVALGCAVQVGVLDDKEEMGSVLNPMQAALLRAVIEKKQRDGDLVDTFDDDDDFDDDMYEVEDIDALLGKDLS